MDFDVFEDGSLRKETGNKEGRIYAESADLRRGEGLDGRTEGEQRIHCTGRSNNCSNSMHCSMLRLQITVHVSDHREREGLEGGE